MCVPKQKQNKRDTYKNEGEVGVEGEQVFGREGEEGGMCKGGRGEISIEWGKNRRQNHPQVAHCPDASRSPGKARTYHVYGHFKKQNSPLSVMFIVIIKVGRI